MSNIAVQVDDVGKLYRLGEVGTGTLSHDLNRWWARIRGKEDPFAQIGELNDRTQKGSSAYVWALKNVSFDVAQGDVVGIIGRNGAGKSTLLKILSKVTAPSQGKIKVKGRIASLLEVGTGFHPELTGKENIFLNGAIMGMSKTEVRSKFDEIVDFAGVERYIDTPVKRYSSGMYVRLAFAVAAFLEPEILIVDEVLAVGDAEFQKKCLGRMKDVSTKEGRTVLFVSHNMAAVRSLCNKGVLMQQGTVRQVGEINPVIDSYVNDTLKGREMIDAVRYFSDYLKIRTLRINSNATNSFVVSDNLMVVDVVVDVFQPIEMDIDIHIKQEEVLVASFAGFTERKIPQLAPGTYHFTYQVPLPAMRSGIYQVDIVFSHPYTRWWAILENFIEMDVQNSQVDSFLNNPALKWGKVVLSGHPEIKRIS